MMNLKMKVPVEMKRFLQRILFMAQREKAELRAPTLVAFVIKASRAWDASYSQILQRLPLMQGISYF